MGWQPDPTVNITLHFRDDDGASSRHIINVAASALPSAGAFATAYAELFQPLSNCALWKVSLSLRYLDDTDPLPPATTDTTRRSVLVFQAYGSPYVLSLPGVVGAKLLQPPHPYAYVGLDPADPDIAALVAAMITGIGGTTPCAPWNVPSTGGGGGGGSWGGGDPDDPSGGREPEDYTWAGSSLIALLTAYWGYERGR